MRPQPGNAYESRHTLPWPATQTTPRRSGDTNRLSPLLPVSCDGRWQCVAWLVTVVSILGNSLQRSIRDWRGNSYPSLNFHSITYCLWMSCPGDHRTPHTCSLTAVDIDRENMRFYKLSRAISVFSRSILNGRNKGTGNRSRTLLHLQRPPDHRLKAYPTLLSRCDLVWVGDGERETD